MLLLGLFSCGLLAPAPASGEDTTESREVPAVGAPGTAPAWQIGLRAGWGISSHAQGALDSDLFITDPDIHLTAQSGFGKAVNEVDLAIDVLTPWQIGIARPFVTFGGGLAVGDNENTGGITSIPTSRLTGGNPTPPGLPESFSGLTSASLEDVANFYTRVGADLAFPMPIEGSTAPFHFRPYAGFDLRAYRGTLNVTPSVLLPVAGPGNLPPDLEENSRFTRVSPLLGAEFVIPLCAHDCWGVDVYFGGEYQFDVGGRDNLSATLDGAQAFASVSGGNVFRGFAGLQYHFRLGGD